MFDEFAFVLYFNGMLCARQWEQGPHVNNIGISRAVCFIVAIVIVVVVDDSVAFVSLSL